MRSRRSLFFIMRSVIAAVSIDEQAIPARRIPVTDREVAILATRKTRSIVSIAPTNANIQMLLIPKTEKSDTEGDRDRSSERCAGRNTQHLRVRQRISKERLHHDTRRSKTSAHQSCQKDSRQTDIPDDELTGIRDIPKKFFLIYERELSQYDARTLHERHRNRTYGGSPDNNNDQKEQKAPSGQCHC